MTLVEIDRALAGWDRHLVQLAERLLALQADPVYRALSGSHTGERLPFTGRTATLAGEAAVTLPLLFQQFGLLEAVLARAGELRRETPTLFGRDRMCRELESLLAGPSVKVPLGSLTAAQRNTLAAQAGEVCLRPEEMRQTLLTLLEHLAVRIGAVGRALEQATEDLPAAQARLLSLTERRARLRCAEPAALRDAASRLASLEDLSRSDPLCALETLHGVVALSLDAAERELGQREAVGAALAEAHRHLARLTEAERQVHDMAESVREKTGISPAAQAPGVDAQQQLAAWLATLERRSGQESPAAVLLGLRRWSERAAEARRGRQEALEAVQQPLLQRNELRGRLEALKSKARSYGLAESAELIPLSGVAEDLLYTRPMRLEPACAAVERYEQALHRACTARPAEGGRTK